MNSRPVRINVPEEEIERIKKKTKATEVYVYDPSFLSEYADKIIATFPENERDIIKKRIGEVKYFVICDKLDLGKLQSGPDKIYMLTEYADITDTSFSLKPEHEYIETIFIHELLHNASRYKGKDGKTINGIREALYDDNGNYLKSKNIALNEGITQYLAEKISGQPVDDDIDFGYAFNKKVVYLLSDVLGESTIRKSYFYDSGHLKNVINGIAKDDNFYDFINKRIDTINKLRTTARKIQQGKIKLDDPLALYRIERVLDCQQKEFVGKILSKVILPQVQTLPVEKRKEYLANLINKNKELLASIENYIPLTNKDDILTDEKIATIQKAIDEQIMDFSKLKEILDSVDAKEKTDDEIKIEWAKKIDEYYQKNMTKPLEHSTTLPKTKYDELFHQVETLYHLIKTSTTKENRAVRDAFRNNLLAFFTDIPNIEEKIDKMLEEVKEKDQAKKRRHNKGTSSKKDKALEDVSDAGAKDAHEATHREKDKDDEDDDVLDQVYNDGAKGAQEAAHRGETNDDTQKDDKNAYGYNLTSKFIHSDVTGEIYDQRNLSIYKKAVNITRATGEMVDLEDKEIVEARNSYADNYISHLPKSSVERLQKLYGDEWEKVIRDAYESGFKMGTKVCMEQAAKEGNDLRKKDEEIISKTGKFPTSTGKIDLEELKFCYENFDVHKKDKGYEVIDMNGKVITNSRTRNMVMFARQWVAACKEDAFGETGEQLYSLIQNQTQKDLEKNGSIDIDNLKSYAADLGDKGDKFSEITTFLFKNNTRAGLVDSYFRMQTPKAIAYTPVSKDSEEKTSSK